LGEKGKKGGRNKRKPNAEGKGKKAASPLFFCDRKKMEYKRERWNSPERGEKDIIWREDLAEK